MTEILVAQSGWLDRSGIQSEILRRRLSDLTVLTKLNSHRGNLSTSGALQRLSKKNADILCSQNRLIQKNRSAGDL